MMVTLVEDIVEIIKSEEETPGLDLSQRIPGRKDIVESK